MGIGGLLLALVWPVCFSAAGLIVNLVVWSRQKRKQQLFLSLACILVSPLSAAVTFAYWGERYDLTLYGVVACIALGIAMLRAWIATQHRSDPIPRLNRKLHSVQF